VIYLIGYYYVIKLGKEAYFTFVTGEKGSFLEPDSDASGSSSYRPVGEEGADEANTTTLLQAQENVRTKLKAILWKRQTIEEGGLFVKYFAVLEKGRLDFY